MNKLSKAKLAAILLIASVCATILSSCSNGPNKTIIVKDTPAQDTITTDEEVVEKIPEIKYRLVAKKKSESPFDENSKIFATIDGTDVLVGTISDIFGKNNMACMDLFEQADFDGDGSMDALVYDVNVGSGGGSVWAFITYAGNNKFNISETFGEASYYDPKISTVDGQKVLDFLKEDLGVQTVMERHGLKNGKVVSMPVPKSKKPSYNILRTVNMDNMEAQDYFYYDLNNDGQDEQIQSTGDYHFGRKFALYMNGREYEFSVGTLWGGGKLHILQSMTNGMHDLMTEQDIRTIYKWNGSTYTDE